MRTAGRWITGSALVLGLAAACGDGGSNEPPSAGSGRGGTGGSSAGRSELAGGGAEEPQAGGGHDAASAGKGGSGGRRPATGGAQNDDAGNGGEDPAVAGRGGRGGSGGSGGRIEEDAGSGGEGGAAELGELVLPALEVQVVTGTSTTVERTLPSSFVGMKNQAFDAVPTWHGRVDSRPSDEGGLTLEVVVEAEVDASGSSELEVSFDGCLDDGCTRTRPVRLPLHAAAVTELAAAAVTTFASPFESRVVRQPDGSGLIPDELSVVLALDQTPENAESLASEVGGAIVGGSSFLRHYELRFADEAAALDAETTLKSDARVLSVRRFVIDEMTPDAAPNEWTGVPLETLAWGDKRFDYGDAQRLDFQAAMDASRLPQAWDIETGEDSRVSVLIVDANIYTPHHQLVRPDGFPVRHAHNPALTSKEIWGQGYSKEELGFDPNGAHFTKNHGTHAAGIACARGNDGRGMHGTSWGCSLRVYDVAAKNRRNTDENKAALATEMRAEFSAPAVVNVSQSVKVNGSCEDTVSQGFDPEGAVVEEWRNFFRSFPDTLFVVSAGNCHAELVNANGTYAAVPAALSRELENVVSVGNVDIAGEFGFVPAGNSNVGPDVTIAAPGTSVLSTAHACDERGANCAVGYLRKSGTSQAAPYVTGIAALMKQIDGDAAPGRIKACLRESGEGIGVLGFPSGMVDAKRALFCIKTAGVYAGDGFVSVKQELVTSSPDVAATYTLEGELSGRFEIRADRTVTVESVTAHAHEELTGTFCGTGTWDYEVVGATAKLDDSDNVVLTLIYGERVGDPVPSCVDPLADTEDLVLERVPGDTARFRFLDQHITETPIAGGTFTETADRLYTFDRETEE